jgi:hypothetical protein
MSGRWPLGPARMAGGFVGWGRVGQEDVAEEVEVVAGSEGFERVFNDLFGFWERGRRA